MALSDILLRTLSHPTLVAKGSALTWVEEDTNFVEIYEALITLNDFTNSGIAAYDGGTTYSEDDIVTYNGFLYTYVNPVPSSGNDPTNPTYWTLTGGASLAHEKNKDQYLDLGGSYQVSAQEIRELLDNPLDLTTTWKISGNDLSQRGVFGSNSSSPFGWDFKVDGVVKGGVENTGEWFFGTTAKFAGTYLSVKSPGTNSTTYNIQFENLSSVLGWLRDDGLFTAFGGISTDGIRSISADTTNHLYLFGGNAGNGHTVSVALFAAGASAAAGASGSQLIAIGSAAGFNQSGANVNLIGNQAGEGNTGNSCTFIGNQSGLNNSGVGVFGFGPSAARENTFNNIFTVGAITQVFWGGVGDKSLFGNPLTTIKVQSSMAEDGTNQDASSSILAHASALGTGTGLSGDLTFLYAPSVGSGTTRHTHSESARMRGPSGDWEFKKNVSIANGKWIFGDFFGGQGNVFQAETTAATTSDPVDGVVYEVINGALFVRLETGEKGCVFGKQITDADDYTQTVGVTTMKYTGTGGHTFMLHTASGYTNTEITVINEGSGGLTCNGKILAVGESKKFKSDGTNWL